MDSDVCRLEIQMHGKHQRKNRKSHTVYKWNGVLVIQHWNSQEVFEAGAIALGKVTPARVCLFSSLINIYKLDCLGH